MKKLCEAQPEGGCLYKCFFPHIFCLILGSRYDSSSDIMMLNQKPHSCVLHTVVINTMFVSVSWWRPSSSSVWESCRVSSAPSSMASSPLSSLWVSWVLTCCSWNYRSWDELLAFTLSLSVCLCVGQEATDGGPLWVLLKHFLQLWQLLRWGEFILKWNINPHDDYWLGKD